MRLHRNLILAVIKVLDGIFNQNLYADKKRQGIGHTNEYRNGVPYRVYDDGTEIAEPGY